jgi:hypothetical protein
MIAALLLKYGIPTWLAKVAAIGLAAGLLIGAAIGYRSHLINSGIAIEATRRDKIDAENSARAGAELARINAKLAGTQAQLTAALAHLDQLKSDLDHEKAASTALQSDLAAGRRRLSVLTRARAPDSAGQAPGAAAAGVDPGAAVTADLDPAAAASTAGLTGEGDAAIIRLNACIQAYDAVKAAADKQ